MKAGDDATQSSLEKKLSEMKLAEKIQATIASTAEELREEMKILEMKVSSSSSSRVEDNNESSSLNDVVSASSFEEKLENQRRELKLELQEEDENGCK